jgi:sodium-dependent dicarboxylate transporter 2/3/5
VSAFVNNTAAMLMMLPTAMALASALGADRRMRAAFTLVTAYACSIGGVATLVGTAPNAVLAGLAPRVAGREITFVGWLGVGVPFVLLAVPTAWWMVTRVTLPLPRDHRAPPTPPPHPGPWSFGERAVGVVVGACLLAWLTRSPVDLGAVTLPGWGPHVPGKVDDGFVAIAGALALFLLPGEALRRGSPPPPQDTHGDDADEAAFLLSWRRMARAVPWSVLVLMGGGFAMADAIQRSGLSHQLARSVAHLGDLPPVLQVLGVCVGISFLSAFTSNTATTQVALPLLGAGAVAAGIDPLAWMVPATISASCDFALAVGTPPNAIAAEAGDVTPGEMAAAGVALNVLCALLATAVTLGPGALALAP